jgi:hypothetical protein
MSEKVSIINAKRKVEGIYKTFDEFRRNQPFYTDSFNILEAEFKFEDTIYPFDNILVLVDRKYMDRVEYDGKMEGTRYGHFHQNQRFYGYCKNDSVYLASWKFHPFLELGHLSLIRVKELQLVRTSLILETGRTKSFDKYMVLDFSDGRFYPISTAELFSKFALYDQDLWHQYKKAKRKRSLRVQIEYLKKFNERNPIRF